ncbi:MlaD family protein, partial [Gluconacetobacter sp.]|uniref:MlaD family protein n=1 Tax=Gluconacetobacter sp. TaxID=1935994 RepID=UPI0039E9AFC3
MSTHPGRTAGWTAVLLFVAGGIGLGCAFLGAFGQFGLMTHSERAMVVFDRPIGGLRAGATVTFRGARLGRVEHVGLTADPLHGRALIPVTIRIQPGRIHMAGGGGGPLSPHQMLFRLIQDGLQAELHSASLVTGRVGIDLDIAPRPPPPPQTRPWHPTAIPPPESPQAQHRRTQ